MGALLHLSYKAFIILATCLKTKTNMCQLHKHRLKTYIQTFKFILRY